MKKEKSPSDSAAECEEKGGFDNFTKRVLRLTAIHRKFYIKRVIGLPGETVEVKNGKVYVDGVEMDDSFTNGPMNRRGDGVYPVPEGCYFFLGDNRNQSKDSRFWKEKYIPIENIQAKAWYIVYPFNRAGHIE